MLNIIAYLAHCTIQHSEWSLMFYSAENVRQIMNSDAIDRHI